MNLLLFPTHSLPFLHGHLQGQFIDKFEMVQLSIWLSSWNSFGSNWMSGKIYFNNHLATTTNGSRKFISGKSVLWISSAQSMNNKMGIIKNSHKHDGIKWVILWERKGQLDYLLGKQTQNTLETSPGGHSFLITPHPQLWVAPAAHLSISSCGCLIKITRSSLFNVAAFICHRTSQHISGCPVNRPNANTGRLIPFQVVANCELTVMPTFGWPLDDNARSLVGQ